MQTYNEFLWGQRQGVSPYECPTFEIMVWGASGSGGHRISLHRSEGFSHLGPSSHLQELAGASRGLRETVWMLSRAFGEALRCNLGVDNLL